MRPARLQLAALVIARLLCVTGAGAEQAHLSYRAPVGCPGEGELLETIARDGGILLRAPEGQPARSFEVTVQLSSVVLGRLVVREIDGTEAVRSIDGARCDEVVRSLAVIVALSLKSAPPASASGEPPSSPEPIPAFAAAPEAAAARTESTESPFEADAVRFSRWRLGTSIEGTLGGGLTAPIDGAVALYVELYRETPDLFAPSLRLGIEKSATETRQWQSGNAWFAKSVARGDTCPFRLMASQPWSTDALTVQACARVDVGQVSARSDSDAGPAVHSLWAAAGSTLRFRWTFPSLFIEGEGAVAFPLTRYHFFPNSTGPLDRHSGAIEVPASIPSVGFGVGALFL